MIYKAYKDDCYIIGLCADGIGDLFDGYLDLSEEEKNQAELAEREFFHWQELLMKRYKKA